MITIIENILSILIALFLVAVIIFIIEIKDNIKKKNKLL